MTSETAVKLYESRAEALDAVALQLSAVSDLPPGILRLLSDKVGLFEETPNIDRSRTSRKWQPILVSRIAIRTDQIRFLEAFLAFLKGVTSIVSGVAALTTVVGICTFPGEVLKLTPLQLPFIVRGMPWLRN